MFIQFSGSPPNTFKTSDLKVLFSTTPFFNEMKAEQLTLPHTVNVRDFKNGLAASPSATKVANKSCMSP